MNTYTDSLETVTPKTPGGFSVGQDSGTGTLDAFYGATPIVQPVGAAQALIVDASGGTAAPTNGVLTITGTYNQTIIANALATVLAQTNAMRTALVNLGLMKGSA